ncbi:hypothetical protein GCM10009547_25850 [Sporichthya brevicatena]|uniref:Uncharacterized protein n=1 Tax=Sporichthya brevicatena TaxID=171442 RepID=A0ABN1GWI1_9ACTN
MSPTRTAFAALVAAATLTLAGAATAAAHPYTDDPEVVVGPYNPPIGGIVWVDLFGFAPSETVELELHSDPVPLGSLKTDEDGEASKRVQLPWSAHCLHEIVATGLTSGFVASTQIVIGGRDGCSSNPGGNLGSGNSGSGNIGEGNTGNGNIGEGNTGEGNTGEGNLGEDNTGSGNVGEGHTGWGNVAHSATLTQDAPGQVAAALLLGLTVTGGVGFLCTRGRRNT